MNNLFMHRTQDPYKSIKALLLTELFQSSFYALNMSAKVTTALNPCGGPPLSDIKHTSQL